MLKSNTIHSVFIKTLIYSYLLTHLLLNLSLLGLMNFITAIILAIVVGVLVGILMYKENTAIVDTSLHKGKYAVVSLIFMLLSIAPFCISEFTGISAELHYWFYNLLHLDLYNPHCFIGIGISLMIVFAKHLSAVRIHITTTDAE